MRSNVADMDEMLKGEEKNCELQVQLPLPEDLILSSAQFAEHPFAKGEMGRAYVLHLESSGGAKKITFFGSPHTSEQDDPVFGQIANEFKDLNPDIVFVEGMVSINNKKDAVRNSLLKEGLTPDSMKREGEPYFVLKLAVDAGIDFESPEPHFADELRYVLEGGFDRESIVDFYLYRIINQYLRECEDLQRPPEVAGCTEEIEWTYEKLRDAGVFSFEEITLYKAKVIADLELDNAAKYENLVDPIPWQGSSQTVINEVARRSSAFRDVHILRQIEVRLGSYDRIFVVYGSAHAVKLEAALAALLRA